MGKYSPLIPIFNPSTDNLLLPAAAPNTPPNRGPHSNAIPYTNDSFITLGIDGNITLTSDAHTTVTISFWTIPADTHQVLYERVVAAIHGAGETRSFRASLDNAPRGVTALDRFDLALVLAEDAAANRSPRSAPRRTGGGGNNRGNRGRTGGGSGRNRHRSRSRSPGSVQYDSDSDHNVSRHRREYGAVAPGLAHPYRRRQDTRPRDRTAQEWAAERESLVFPFFETWLSSEFGGVVHFG